LSNKAGCGSNARAKAAATVLFPAPGAPATTQTVSTTSKVTGMGGVGGTRAVRIFRLLRTERAWLPTLAERLPLPTPVPVRIGQPSSLFAWILLQTGAADRFFHAYARADCGRVRGPIRTMPGRIHSGRADHLSGAYPLAIHSSRSNYF
jgi:hypothetical protein